MATSYDLLALANTLRQAGTDINQRINDDMGNLDFHQVQELSNKAQDLFIKSKTALELATIQISEEGAAALNKLNDASADVSKVIKTIKTVQSVINIAAKLVSVAGSVLSGDYAQAATDAQSVVDTVTSLING